MDGEMTARQKKSFVHEPEMNLDPSSYSSVPYPQDHPFTHSHVSKSILHWLHQSPSFLDELEKLEVRCSQPQRITAYDLTPSE